MKCNAVEKSALCTVVDQLYRMVSGSADKTEFRDRANATYAAHADAFLDGVRFAAQFIEDRHLGIARLQAVASNVCPIFRNTNDSTAKGATNECRPQ